MGPIDHGRFSGHLTQERQGYIKGTTHGLIRENQAYCGKRGRGWSYGRHRELSNY